MGYVTMTREELASIEDLNIPQFENATPPVQLDGSRARKLLRSFAQGRWRSRLSGVREHKAAA